MAATYIPLEDPDDPRVRDYVALRDSSLRKSLETERGIFIAEGTKVIQRAIVAGYPPRSFLLAERWLPTLQPLLDVFDGSVFIASEAITEQITGFHVHRGALAALERITRHTAADVMSGRRIVVAEDIVDHTNVGAIIRNTAALGWDGLLISPRCADPLYRRAIKVSMGAVFSLPWARLDNWNSIITELKASGFLVAALALREDAINLSDFRASLKGRSQKLAILLGTEGEGLSANWLHGADIAVRIPMHAGIDSLNVAAATAIACYELA